MKRIFRQLYSGLVLFGIDPKKTCRAVQALPTYFRNRAKLRHQQKTSKHEFAFGRSYPCLGDRFAESGSTKSVYFQQDLLVARRVFLNNPTKHVDVGSRIDGFVAHVASFRELEVLDIRPLSTGITNVRFAQADMMQPIDANLRNYCDSLSCLHTIEHFGLGRYGDPINYDGYLLGLNNLNQILKPSGTLYFSVPIGPQRIEFDAHRVFSLKYLLELFRDDYQIEQFSYIDDDGLLFENVPLSDSDIENNFGCNYGCCIFEMIKGG